MCHPPAFASIEGVAIRKHPQKPRNRVHGTVCQVKGCCKDLTRAKGYCRRKHLCAEHMQAESVLLLGSATPLRYCFQCGKLEETTKFDGNKRTCRARLLQRRSSAAYQQLNTCMKGSTRSAAAARAPCSDTPAALPAASAAAPAAAAVGLASAQSTASLSSSLLSGSLPSDPEEDVWADDWLPWAEDMRWPEDVCELQDLESALQELRAAISGCHAAGPRDPGSQAVAAQLAEVLVQDSGLFDSTDCGVHMDGDTAEVPSSCCATDLAVFIKSQLALPVLGYTGSSSNSVTGSTCVTDMAATAAAAQLAHVVPPAVAMPATCAQLFFAPPAYSASQGLLGGFQLQTPACAGQGFAPAAATGAGAAAANSFALAARLQQVQWQVCQVQECVCQLERDLGLQAGPHDTQHLPSAGAANSI